MKSYPHERLFAGYLLFLVLLMLVSGSELVDRWSRIAVHIASAAAIIYLMPQFGDTGWKTVVRHWLPIFFLGFVYTELRVLNDMFASGFHDATIIGLEYSLFLSEPAISLRAWVPFIPLSEYLHFAYFSYYFLFPALTVSLMLRHRLNELRYAMAVTLAAFLFCYTIFILYPVGGPWNTYERPLLSEVGHFFPNIVHWILERGESVGTAFPSSHVAGSLTIWLITWQVDRRLFRWMTLIVPALIVGTVYGGFHYVVDSVLGIGVGVAFFRAGPWIYRRLGGHEPVQRG